jgi:phosphinothricin acetyltransferase
MINIREFKEPDFNSVKEIYQQGIDTGNATFQETAKSWLEWNNSMLPACRIVAVENNDIVGWAALSPVSSRSVYSGVAEVSVYVANESFGKGIGKTLLTHLIGESEANNIWMLQAGIFPENKASIALHEKCGFRVLGIRDKLGKMKGVWRDVVLMERRSSIIGVN